MPAEERRQLPGGTLDAPEPDERVTGVWVLVCIHPNSGEGIYGAVVGGDMLMNFVTSYPGLRDKMEAYARKSGAYEQFEAEGGRMEWRHYTVQWD